MIGIYSARYRCEIMATDKIKVAVRVRPFNRRGTYTIRITKQNKKKNEHCHFHQRVKLSSPDSFPLCGSVVSSGWRFKKPIFVYDRQEGVRFDSDVLSFFSFYQSNGTGWCFRLLRDTTSRVSLSFRTFPYLALVSMLSTPG